MGRERWKNSARGRESTSNQGSQREDFILFYSMFPFLGSFPHRLSPSLSELPHKVASAVPPQLFFFILAVYSSGWGWECPKPGDLPGSEKHRRHFV